MRKWDKERKLSALKTALIMNCSQKSFRSRRPFQASASSGNIAGALGSGSRLADGLKAASGRRHIPAKGRWPAVAPSAADPWCLFPGDLSGLVIPLRQEHAHTAMWASACSSGSPSHIQPDRPADEWLRQQ